MSQLSNPRDVPRVQSAAVCKRSLDAAGEEIDLVNELEQSVSRPSHFKPQRPRRTCDTRNIYENVTIRRVFPQEFTDACAW